MAVSHIGRGGAAARRGAHDPARRARTLPGNRPGRGGEIADISGPVRYPGTVAPATMARTHPPMGGGRMAG